MKAMELEHLPFQINLVSQEWREKSEVKRGQQNAYMSEALRMTFFQVPHHDDLSFIGDDEKVRLACLGLDTR